MTFGLSQSQQKKIRSIFEKYPQVKKAAVFGSRAMGNFKPGSDVDIALFGPLDDVILARIGAELNEETTLPYQFDLIRYDQIHSQELKEHIDRYGKEFCRT